MPRGDGGEGRPSGQSAEGLLAAALEIVVVCEEEIYFSLIPSIAEDRLKEAPAPVATRAGPARLLAPVPYRVGAWPIEGEGRSFRHFRIWQHGVNGMGEDYLMCCGIEIYGELTEA